MSTTQQQGKIKITLPGSGCSENIFRIKYSEYESETNHLLYAESESPDSLSCSGGYLLLISREGKRFGEIRIMDEMYEIEDLGGVNALVRTSFTHGDSTVCTGPLIPDEEEEDFGDENSLEFRAGENCDVRVLILFTPAAFNRVNDIFARAETAIATTNQSFRNSRMFPNQVKLILAATEELNFNEQGMSMEQVLRDLRINLTAISRRNFHQADLVMMLVDKNIMDPDDTAVGRAYLEPPANFAFGVSRVLFISQSLTFSHEIGHLFGARHEPCDAERAGANCADASGGRFDHAHSWTQFRWRSTIMFSYGSSGRIPYFSNPNVRYLNRVTGIANERDNARKIVSRACTVANFRGQNESLSVSILGSAQITFGASEILSVQISGAPGPYQYQWFTSQDGISWTFASGTPDLFVYGANMNVGDLIFIRVNVTAGNGALASAWHAIEMVEGFYMMAPWRGSGEHTFAEREEAFQIVPNPTSGRVQIRYHLSMKSDIAFKVFALSGKEVLYLNRKGVESGEHMEEFNLEQLLPGVYFLKFSDGERIVVRKIVKN